MMKTPLVVLDAGHGGKDPGALGPSGLREKDVALSVARLVQATLIGAGLSVRLTRPDDTFLELPERASIANAAGADLFVSIHCNSATRPASGFEVYTTPGQTVSDSAATEIFNAIGAAFPTLTRRFDSTDGDPDKEANFAVLRLTKMAAVLIELEFIHTAAGEVWLRDPVNQAKYAKAIAAGILAHLKIAQPAGLDGSNPGDDQQLFVKFLEDYRKSQTEVRHQLSQLGQLMIDRQNALEVLARQFEAALKGKGLA